MLEGSGVSVRIMLTRSCITLWNALVAAAPSLTSCNSPQAFLKPKHLLDVYDSLASCIRKCLDRGPGSQVPTVQEKT